MKCHMGRWCSLGLIFSSLRQARNLLQRGDVQSMVDPVLDSNYRMESVWRLVELAISSVEQEGRNRPTMAQIVLEITEIIRMETRSMLASASLTESLPTFSSRRSEGGSPSASYSYDYDVSSGEIAPSGKLSESFEEPTVR